MKKVFKVGTALPSKKFTATNVSLFLYNAAVWNAHRIHYDENYTINSENHPGIVIDGPLQGDWLTQIAIDWMGNNATLKEFEYTNRIPSYLGETLVGGGTVEECSNDSVRLNLFLKNSRGEVTTPGRAMFQLD